MQPSQILIQFGIRKARRIKQIHKSAWSIDDTYILKRSSDLESLRKSILLSYLLLREGIPVPEYIRTSDGAAFISVDDTHYVLMKKIMGRHIDPFKGNPYKNGVLLGRLVAELHRAMGKIGPDFDCYDADYMLELDDWIMPKIREGQVPVRQEVIDYCYGFGPLYKTLPRQLIHRDVHTSNMIFRGRKLSGWLDFDNSQINVRLHDLCYLGVTMLVGNYDNERRFAAWREIFRGVLDGYQCTFSLTEGEMEAIPYMFIMAELTFAAFFAKIGQMDIAAVCAEMAEWLYENRERLL